ncbi:MAG: hypothetical protein HWN68_20405, partial [Desulfobacterales bacterium]|nr:hypothetical protein [Desulfobacterales bacterium]
IVIANPDDKGQAELSADTEGEGKIRVEGRYLADVLKACGGMVDLQISSPISPMLFSHDGYSVVVMPMLTAEAQKQAADDSKAEAAADKPTKPKAKGKKQGKGKAEKQAKTEPVPEPTAETEPEPEPAKA